MLAGVPPIRFFAALIVLAVALPAAQTPRGPIDRRALVDRHAPVLNRFDTESPLSVGNGEFAFTVDVTGLQTFPEAFNDTIPLGTLSNWGWHTAPNPRGWSIDEYEFTPFDRHGRKVGFADIPGERTDEVNWLRANPHRLHLRVPYPLRLVDCRPEIEVEIARTDVFSAHGLQTFAITGAIEWQANHDRQGP